MTNEQLIYDGNKNRCIDIFRTMLDGVIAPDRNPIRLVFPMAAEIWTT